MSFINPYFLFALGAAVLPVLYHLVRKMKAKEVPFSSLMFLKATPKELVRKRRLRDLLLMAVRAFIFALLALAFARPFLPKESIPFIPQRAQQSVVLLLDNSLSMQYDGRFEEAREAVLDRIAATEEGDELAVVVFADEARQLTELGRDRAVHQGAVAQAEASYRPTDFYKALRRAEEILQGAHHEARTVVLVSDFQGNGWSGSFENWKLTPDVDFIPVQIGDGAAENVYVEAFHLSQKRAGEQVVVGYDARVAAQGARRAQEHTTTLSLDGATIERQPVSAAARVSYQQTAPREGLFQGEMALEGDALPADDRFYFTYTVGDRPALLGVDDGGARGDAFFLRSAFDLGEDARYTFSTANRRQLDRTLLRRHDVVFLAGVSGLTASQVEALKNYVEDGGSLVLSFGDGADYAALLPALGVGRVGETVAARTAQGQEAIIGEVDLRHPVFTLFAGAGSSAILRPRFRRYAEVVPDTATVVLGHYDTEAPFLIERQLGRGKVLVYTSTFDTDWTDFPLNELYVPFLYQLVAYARTGADAQHLYTVGDVVTLEGRPGDVWEVQAPGNRLYRVSVDNFGTGFFRETEVPGHYAAALGREQYLFSVNVDPRESELDARDEEEVYAAVVAPPEDAPKTPEQAVAMAIEDEEKQQKLWRYLILLVVGLFAFETYYANRSVKRKT